MLPQLNWGWLVSQHFEIKLLEARVHNEAKLCSVGHKQQQMQVKSPQPLRSGQCTNQVDFQTVGIHHHSSAQRGCCVLPCPRPYRRISSCSSRSSRTTSSKRCFSASSIWFRRSSSCSKREDRDVLCQHSQERLPC